jgi:uncharacterized integral membrane protein
MESEEQRPPEESPPEQEADEQPLRDWQLRLYLTLITIGLVLAYGIAFVLENNKHVNLHFVFATARVSLVWLVLLSVALGMLLGVLLSQLYRRRRHRSRD